MRLLKNTLLALGIIFLSGCNSQPIQPIERAPRPLPVFQKEIINLSVSSSPTISAEEQQSFKRHLSSRLKLYGAHKVLFTSRQTSGLKILVQIKDSDEGSRHAIVISRGERPLISEDYSSNITAEQAINAFLHKVHHQIASASSFF